MILYTICGILFKKDILRCPLMNSLIYIQINYLLLTKSFNAFPALKTGAFDAGILISSLV